MVFSHVGLNCRDMAATEAFYSQLFGFRRARVFDIGDGAQIVFLKLGEVYLELFAAEGEHPGHDADGPHHAGSLRHIAFQVDDVDAVLAKLENPDISLGPASFDAFIPGWKTVWLRDPDGVIVEVSQGFRDNPDLIP